MKMLVSKRVSFDAAHFLPNYTGKCSQLHGHRWTVELGVNGEVDPETGMVIDFVELSNFLKEKVVDRFDHTLLNDVIENPTAENIAGRVKLSWDLWKDVMLAVKLGFIRVWETPDSFAELKA